AELLGVSRSTIYYRPVIDLYNIEIMRYNYSAIAGQRWKRVYSVTLAFNSDYYNIKRGLIFMLGG
ncbi:MAG: hypothetical protein ACE5EA_03295, partial [Nitrospirota bacterium]